MTDTTAQHIAARDDEDLKARIIAAAEQAHLPEPENFVRMNLGKIISTPVSSGATITSVHAYTSTTYAAAVSARDAAIASLAATRDAAVAQLEDDHAAALADLAALPQRPGSDLAAVTDDQISQAIAAVWAPFTE